MKRESVRARILAAAETEIGALGYTHMTMDHLAETLGISKRTLYEHFRSKDRLVLALINNKGKAISEAQAAIMKSGVHPVEKLYMVGQVVQKFVSTVLRADLLKDIHRNAPDLWRHVKNMRQEKIRRLWIAIITEGKRRGDIRKDFPAEIVIIAYIATMEKLLEPEFAFETPRSLDQSRAHVLDLFVNGLVTPKGRKVSSLLSSRYSKSA